MGTSRSIRGRRAAGGLSASVLAAVLVAGLAAGCGESSAEKLRSDDRADRLEALGDLAEDGSDPALEAAAEAIRHDDILTARMAVRTVERMRRRKVYQALRDATEDPRPQVREEATLALGRLRDAESAATLVRRLRSDPDPSVRAAAATAIGRLGDRDLVGALVEAALKEEDLRVQSCAVGAVAKLAHVRFGYDSRASRKEREAALEVMRRWAWRGGWLPGSSPPPEDF